MVHEEGFSIEKDCQGEWFFQRPDGQAIAHGAVYSENVSPETLLRAAPNFTEDLISAETMHSGGRIEEPKVAYG